ncbi:MAG: hypothetical protein NVSMB14_14780 [Isosphaeraceae bacterium]
MKKWDDVYRTTKHPEPGRIWGTVSLLAQVGDTPPIEAALVGYLRHHADLAEPWMYEMLAETMEFNKASPKAVKTALDYAATLAVRKADNDPNGLTSVAVLLLKRKFHDRVGELLDLATKKSPFSLRPMLLSTELAKQTGDAKRMVDALDRILSLGWPTLDKAVRAAAQKLLNGMAEDLRDDGSKADAVALESRWRDLSARDVFIRLSWVGDADLDLAVTDPLGTVAKHDTPGTVAGGVIVQDGRGKKNSEEIYVCPRGFDGEYSVLVVPVYTDPDRPITRATLEIITHEGLKNERRDVYPIRLDKPIKPIVFRLKGGRRTKALPYVAVKAQVVADAKGENKGKGKNTSKNESKTALKAPKPASTTSKPAGPDDRPVLVAPH